MKRIILSSAAGVLLCLAGCIDYEETLTLNADGSGSVKMHFAIDKAFVNDMKATSPTEVDSADNEPLCTEEEMRATLESMNSGLELIGYKETETEKMVAYDVELKFADYDDFKDLESACPNEAYGSGDGWQFAYDEQPDGTWLFSRQFQGQGSMEDGAMPGDEMTEEEYAAMMDEMQNQSEDAGEAEAEEPDDTNPESEDEEAQGPSDEANEQAAKEFEETMQKLAAGMQRMEEDAKSHKIKLVVKLPGEVVQSNATKVEGRTVTWEYTLDKMQEAPETFTATVRP